MNGWQYTEEIGELQEFGEGTDEYNLGSHHSAALMDDCRWHFEQDKHYDMGYTGGGDTRHEFYRTAMLCQAIRQKHGSLYTSCKLKQIDAGCAHSARTSRPALVALASLI